MLCNKIKEKFTTHVPTVSSNRKSTHFPPAKPAESTSIPPLQNLANPTKDGLFTKNQTKKPSNNKPINKPPGPAHLYVQVSSTPNIQEILKLKENFPKLSDKKSKKFTEP